eukprot:m.12860 g.12860  ORF g.12860 m.12860 type:complete len:278 (+) comp10041_c0_seq1:118-951(+)
MADTFLAPLVDTMTFGLTTWYETKYANFEIAHDGRDFLDTHFYIIAGCVVAYLPLIFGLQHLMEANKPMPIKPLLFSWNVSLVLFNLYSMYYLLPTVLRFVADGNVLSLSCGTDPYFTRGPGSHAIMLFGLSKVPEMLDTVFLVLRKRPVILLHWWHHISVTLYCWSILYSPQVDEGAEGAIFGAMNSVVHVVMYAYYAARVLGFKPPGDYLITTMQLVQMVIGATVAGYRVFCCPNLQRPAHAWSGLLMYVSYFYLFGVFFLNRYVFKKPVAKKAE